MKQMNIKERKLWMKFKIKREEGKQLSIPLGQLYFYTNYLAAEDPIPLNTTFDLPLPNGVFGNLYNFSYPELANNASYFNNSIFYRIGGDVGFVKDMEIQGFRTYNLEEVL